MNNPSVTIPAIGDQHAEICQSIESICQRFPAQYWRDLEDAPVAQRYPEDFVETLEQSGFMSPLVPEEFGGVGLSLAVAVKIAQAVHFGGSNAGTFIAQNRLVYLLATYASSEMRQDVLSRVAAGKARIQSLAVFEPGFGDNIELMQTRALKTSRGWIINGRKRWVHYVDKSDFMVLAARTGSEAGQISLFLVDLEKHRSARAMKCKFIDAMNNNGGAEIILDDLELEESCVIGAINSAGVYLRNSQTVESLLTASAAYGDSRFFSRKAVDYARERVVFGNAIGKYQGVQFPIARTYIEAQGAEVVLNLAIALWETGRDCSDEAIMAQYLAANAAWDSADAAFSTHGGFAFAREYDIERKWREVRAMRNTVAGALPHIAEAVLGLPNE